MFGVALDELMGPDGEFSAVPPVIRDCVAYLRSQGLNEQGLFRRSPSTTILRQLEGAYDRGQRVDIANYGDPHLAAVLIKKFFRMLPHSIFSKDMYNVIRKCPVPDDEGTRAASIEYVREHVIGGLPGNTQVLLNVVLRMWISFNATDQRVYLAASRTPSRSLKKFSQESYGRPQPCRSLYTQPRTQRQPSPRYANVFTTKRSLPPEWSKVLKQGNHDHNTGHGGKNLHSKILRDLRRGQGCQ
jgi:hypothetical protein